MLLWRLNRSFSCIPTYHRRSGMSAGTHRHAHAWGNILCELWNRTFICWSLVLLGLISYSRGCLGKAAIFKMSLDLSSAAILHSLKAWRKEWSWRQNNGGDFRSFTNFFDSVVQIWHKNPEGLLALKQTPVLQYSQWLSHLQVRSISDITQGAPTGF